MLELKDLTMSYDICLLDHVNYIFPDTGLVGIKGPSGCGKSTLLKMILQKNGTNDEKLDVLEEGVCENASGLVISYLNQDAKGLKGNITSFCRERELDQSLFCAILR